MRGTGSSRCPAMRVLACYCPWSAGGVDMGEVRIRRLVVVERSVVFGVWCSGETSAATVAFFLAGVAGVVGVLDLVL